MTEKFFSMLEDMIKHYQETPLFWEDPTTKIEEIG